MSEAPPPIVLASGHQCDARVFGPQIKALGLGGAMLAEHRLDSDFGEMAARLLRDAPPRFGVIGFSLGGMLVLELMEQAPERLLGAALIGTDASPAPQKELEWRSSVYDGLPEKGEAERERLALWLSKRFFGHAPATQARLEPTYLAMARATETEAMLRQGAALSARRDRTEALAAFARSGKPVTMICGALDRLCPVEEHRRMKQAAPEVELMVIEECGHMASLERPEIVNAALADWLRRL